MLPQIISSILMILSAGVILFLIGRKIPSSIKNLDKETTKIDIPSENKNKTDLKDKLSLFFEALLKKIKVLVLKSDAKLMQLIKNFQERKKEGESLTIEEEDSEPKAQT
ncbi:MAG: hypothetical protein GF347_02805, partial [Candidatus Moranbacteria bacterium]|nr:hypothetical protein [Candidatus Moranbacteria bacterium]